MTEARFIPFSEGRKGEQQNKIIKQMIDSLVGDRLIPLKQEARERIFSNLENLEKAEMEVKEKLKEKNKSGYSRENRGSAVAETVLLLSSDKCPKDFIEFLCYPEKNLETGQVVDFNDSLWEFLFGVPADKRKEEAKKRKGETLEEYYLEYLLKFIRNQD